MNSLHRLSAIYVAAASVAALLCGGTARADKIKHPTAVFAGLDKITGRIISFEVAINETVQFGSLQITPRVCFSRPSTEAPQTDAFAEVDEIETDKSIKRIFSGWMFADSPGLHGIEHPVYDLWLTDCKGEGQLIHEAPPVPDVTTDLGAPDAAAAPATPALDPKAQLQAQPAKKPRKPRAAGDNSLDLNTVPSGGVLSAPLPAPLPAPALTTVPLSPAPARQPRRVTPTDAPIPPADLSQ